MAGINDNRKRDFSEVLRELDSCKNVFQKREKLFDLGVNFLDRNYGHEEEENERESAILEEQAALPHTERQRRLVSFFEGKDQPSASIVQDFVGEQQSGYANFPLIMRYFRACNSQLKALIVYGLKEEPVNTSLLNSLAFFSEFDFDVVELIMFYTFACRECTDNDVFTELVKEFYRFTILNGYDPLFALMHDHRINLEKKAIIKQLKILFKADFQE